MTAADTTIPNTGRADRMLAFGIAYTLAYSAAFLAALWGRTIGHDTAWYLLSTRDWLAGARLYVDILELNPPMNSYLTVPPLLLAELLGISDVHGQYVFVIALTAVSLFWSWSILRERIALSPARQALALLGLSLVLTLPMLGEIAQREHLMTVLALPWFLGAVPGPKDPAPRRIARAVPAAIGLCLKPYFLAFPLAVTLWQMLRLRSLRPLLSAQNITILVIGAAYVGIVAWAHPAYFSDIAPTGVKVYGAFEPAFLEVLIKLTFFALPFLPFLIISAIAPDRIPEIPLFLIGIAAGAAAYFVQAKGFHYHMVPFLAFALLAAVWTIVTARSLTPVVLSAVLSIPVFLYVTLYYAPRTPWPDADILAAMGADARPDSLFAATTRVDAGPLVALMTGARWTSRYPQNWTVPGALAGLTGTDCAQDPVTCADFERILHRTRDHNIDDITSHKPEIILIDKRRGFFSGDHFSWYEFFETSPLWAAEIANYRLTRSMPKFDVWTRLDGKG